MFLEYKQSLYCVKNKAWKNSDCIIIALSEMAYTTYLFYINKYRQYIFKICFSLFWIHTERHLILQIFYFIIKTHFLSNEMPKISMIRTLLYYYYILFLFRVARWNRLLSVEVEKCLKASLCHSPVCYLKESITVQLKLLFLKSKVHGSCRTRR